ncbi:MAG: T9SS type A sorting domain-containing protein [Bacteroidales bacterium]|nr:T9SS type A sorting domain-containing protein [Bacteroidales bacterium]
MSAMCVAYGQENTPDEQSRAQETENSQQAEAQTTEKIQTDTSSLDLQMQQSTDNSIEVYNLCGQLVSDQLKGLSKGVYIVKQNGSSRKVIVR